MVSSLVEESFYYKPAAEAFKFIHNRLRTQGDVPDWTGLTGDPSISEDTRKILRSSKEEPAISKAKVQSIVDTLEKYRKLRALVEMAQGVLDRIEDKELDLDELVEDTTNKLTAARQRGDTGTALHHIGKGNNTVGLLKEMLYGKKKPSVPTGFKAFDERNGGILLGSLWTIGANTGGGKCLVGESQITLSDGNLQQISALWDNCVASETSTYNGKEKLFAQPLPLLRRDGKTVEAVGMYKTRGKVMRITLEDGKQLTGLPEHKVKVDRNGDSVWVCLKDLALDDEVLTA